MRIVLLLLPVLAGCGRRAFFDCCFDTARFDTGEELPSEDSDAPRADLVFGYVFADGGTCESAGIAVLGVHIEKQDDTFDFTWPCDDSSLRMSGVEPGYYTIDLTSGGADGGWAGSGMVTTAEPGELTLDCYGDAC